MAYLTEEMAKLKKRLKKSKKCGRKHARDLLDSDSDSSLDIQPPGTNQYFRY